MSTNVVRALILERSSSRFVIDADRIATIERAAETENVEVVSLNELLFSGRDSGYDERRLVVGDGAHRAVFEVDARIRFEELRGDAFFALPRPLRDRCAPWVRGIVDLDGAGALAIWIEPTPRMARGGEG